MASINRLSPILAIAVGVLHAGLSSVVAVGGIRANLVLVACVVVAASAGFGPGVTWAFLAGLTANLLTSEPLGAVPLVLLAVCAATALAAPLAAPIAAVYPVLAVLVGSVVADIGLLALRSLVSGDEWSGVPLGLLIPAAGLNAVIAALVVVVWRLLGRPRRQLQR